MPGYRQLIAVLGQPDNSPTLRKVLADIGGPNKPPRDDTQLSFLSFLPLGISFAYEDEATLFSKNQPLGGVFFLTAIHLYSQGFENFSRFEGELPSGLTFEFGRDAVQEKLGPPSVTGGGKRALGRVWPNWDRYHYSDHALNVQYSDNLGTIDLITLIAPMKAQALTQRKP